MAGEEQERYRIVVIGVSVGGMTILPVILGHFPPDYALPVVVVHHMSPDTDNTFFMEYLRERISLKVREACDKEPIEKGHVYLAPANYHLLIEKDKTFSLSMDAKVNHSRPSVDVLFESAADVYGPAAVGIILTGASADGAKGLAKIKGRGGLAIVQEPESAKSDVMPRAAMSACRVDYAAPMDKIPGLLLQADVERREGAMPL